MARRITVLVNVSSGGDREAEETRRRLADALARHGLAADISLVHDGKALTALAAAAVRGGAEILAAGGGDGTVSAIAAAVAGSPAALGVLPLGTLNHFAKDLKIPLDLEGAVGTLAAGRVVAVDVGEANGRVFVNNSSLGLYARLVRERERHQERGWRKWPALVLASLGVLRRIPFLTVRLSVGDRTLVRTTPLVFVGNNAYEIEGLEIGRRERLDAGVLCVCVAHYDGVRGLLRLAASALLGRLRKHRDFDMFLVPEVSIDARRKRLPVAFDGEVVPMDLPLDYRVRSRALRVVVPAP